MPQGKGTYGSAVGRPPKKLKKYQEGGQVPQEQDPIADAIKMGEELENIPLGNMPITNAQDRNEVMYEEGGKVQMYDKGGPVMDKLFMGKVRKEAEKSGMTEDHGRAVGYAVSSALNPVFDSSDPDYSRERTFAGERADIHAIVKAVKRGQSSSKKKKKK